MTPISIGRIALPFLALTAACGAAFVSGFPREKQPPGETRAATTAVSPRSPDSGDEIMPAFDVTLIGPTGDAVIAGTAAPGAAVELLRNGELQDRAVADQSGQFVMIPPQFSPGDYELTLSSRQPDGRQATSKQSVVVVVVNEVGSDGTGTVRAHSEASPRIR